MRFKILLILSLLFAYIQIGKAESIKGYKISTKALDADGQMLYFAKYKDSEVFALDSAKIDKSNTIIFSSQETLPSGQYLLYIKPESQFELLIDEKEQADIKVELNKANPIQSTVSGSTDTKLYWDYIAHIQTLNAEITEKNKKLDKKNISPTERININKQIDDIKAKIDLYTQDQIGKYKDRWYGIYLKGYQNVELPVKNTQTEEDISINLNFLKEHYFDNISFEDPRFWNTSYFVPYLDYYFEQFVSKTPDSIAVAASKIVGKTQGNDKCFMQMLSRFVNSSQKSNVMGMENIWARLFEDYIENKNVAWIDSTQYRMLTDMYDRIRFNRVGMVAKNIPLTTLQGDSINTDDIKAEYLLLYFYSPNCGHCRTETPAIYNGTFKKFKDEGLTVIAINLEQNIQEAQQFISEMGLTDPKWINCNTPGYKSEYWLNYDISGTPVLYLLDRNKRIVAKKINEQNLSLVLEYIYKK